MCHWLKDRSTKVKHYAELNTVRVFEFEDGRKLELPLNWSEIFTKHFLADWDDRTWYVGDNKLYYGYKKYRDLIASVDTPLGDSVTVSFYLPNITLYLQCKYDTWEEEATEIWLRLKGWVDQ